MAKLKFKQLEIVSGTHVKSVNNISLLGSGNVVMDKVFIGLSNVDNTADANKPISTATQTALNGKQATIAAGTTAQYYRGDKSWQTLNKTVVGLANVDNTSDANKPISTATQTALNDKQATLTNPITGTGTSGQVAFFNATTGLTSSSLFVWDNANGRLGIDTASPTQKLQVDSGNILVRGTNNYLGSNNEAIVMLGDPFNYIKAIFGNGVRIGAYQAVDAITLQQTSGNVGIGNTSPSQKLTVNGNAGNTTGVWVNNSDVRVKEVTGDFNLGLNELIQINPVRFKYNEKSPFYDGGKEQIGVIAQDLETIVPEMVFKQETEAFEDMLFINPQAYNFMFINAIKELKQEIEFLKQKV